MKRLLLGLLAALLLAAPLSAQAKSPESFSQEMIALLRKSDPGGRYTIDPEDPLHVVGQRTKGDEKPAEFHIYFDRIYAFCTKNPGPDCDAERTAFVRAMSTPFPDNGAKAIRVIVRDQEYVDAATGYKDKDGQPMALAQPLGGGLHMLLALDSPDAIAIIGAGRLKELELDQTAAWTLGTIQTRSILPPLPKAADLKQSWIVFEGREYYGSLLVDLAAWQRISDEVGPDLFVTVTSDQLVVVGTIKDGDGLDKLAEATAQDCAAASRCISPHVYRFRDGEWVVAK